MVGTNITTYAPLTDVLCGHPYARSREAMEQAVTDLQAIREAVGKPLLVNECVPGCLDDHKRAEAARYSSELLAAAGFGWMGWSIKEGQAVSTRRDRMDRNGLDDQGFHAWFTCGPEVRLENQLRPGLEFLTEPPTLRPPWGEGGP
jgi:hypothetical protein